MCDSKALHAFAMPYDRRQQGSDHAPDNRPLSVSSSCDNAERDVMIRNLRELNLGMNAAELTDVLLGDGVLSVGEYDRISTEVSNVGKYGANRKLSHLMIFKNGKDIARFLQRLRELQPELIEELELRHEDGHQMENETTTTFPLPEEGPIACSPLVDQLLLSPSSPLPPPACASDKARSEIERLRSELQAARAETIGYRETVAELTSAAFASAPDNTQRKIVAKARVRHADVYKNSEPNLRTWKDCGRLPRDTKGCNACAVHGFVYISVLRDETNIRELLRSRTADLRFSWESCELPDHGDTPWERAKIFTDDTFLFSAVTPSDRRVKYSVYRQEVHGAWEFITDLPNVHYDFRIAVAHGMLIVAGGNFQGNVECHEVSAYQLSQGTRGSWRKIAYDPLYRCVPSILSYKNHIHVLGGTGNEEGTSTVVTTLIRTGEMSYRYSTDIIDPMPVEDTFGAMANGTVIIAGGRRLDNPNADLAGGERRRECSSFDPIERCWTALPPLNTCQSTPELFAYQQRIYCLWGAVDDSKDRCRRIEVLQL